MIIKTRDMKIMSPRQVIVSNQDLPEDCYREIAEKIAQYCSEINQFLP